MQKFEESRICLSRIHCGICRQKQQGRQWRELIGRVFQTSGVEFECPIGLPWADVVEPTPVAPVVTPVAQAVPASTPVPPPPLPIIRKLQIDPRQPIEAGKLLHHFAYGLRQTLPPDSPLVYQLQQADELEKHGGCRGCRAKRVYKALTAAYTSAAAEQKQIVDSVISGAVLV